jgi:hypothetical protein
LYFPHFVVSQKHRIQVEKWVLSETHHVKEGS